MKTVAAENDVTINTLLGHIIKTMNYIDNREISKIGDDIIKLDKGITITNAKIPLRVILSSDAS